MTSHPVTCTLHVVGLCTDDVTPTCTSDPTWWRHLVRWLGWSFPADVGGCGPPHVQPLAVLCWSVRTESASHISSSSKMEESSSFSSLATLVLSDPAAQSQGQFSNSGCATVLVPSLSLLSLFRCDFGIFSNGIKGLNQIWWSNICTTIRNLIFVLGKKLDHDSRRSCQSLYSCIIPTVTVRFSVRGGVG